MTPKPIVKYFDVFKDVQSGFGVGDRVISFFEQQEVPLLRILTDHGTEYCGSIQHHEYQLYLAATSRPHSRDTLATLFWPDSPTPGQG